MLIRLRAFSASATPFIRAKRRGPTLPNFGNPLLMPTTFWPRTTKFGKITRGEERVSGGLVFFNPMERGFCVPIFFRAPIYAHNAWPNSAR